MVPGCVVVPDGRQVAELLLARRAGVGLVEAAIHALRDLVRLLAPAGAGLSEPGLFSRKFATRQGGGSFVSGYLLTYPSFLHCLQGTSNVLAIILDTHGK